MSDELDLWTIGRQFNKHSGAQPTVTIGLQRAQLELTEAMEAITLTDKVTEMADVVLTLASLCHYMGLDLEAAVQKKHRINMQRTWEPHPDLPGAVRRVK